MKPRAITNGATSALMVIAGKTRLTMKYLTEQQILLCKFPAFDGEWDATVQCSWLDNFMRLMDLMERLEVPDEQQK